MKYRYFLALFLVGNLFAGDESNGGGGNSGYGNYPFLGCNLTTNGQNNNVGQRFDDQKDVDYLSKVLGCFREEVWNAFLQMAARLNSLDKNMKDIKLKIDTAFFSELKNKSNVKKLTGYKRKNNKFDDRDSSSDELNNQQESNKKQKRQPSRKVKIKNNNDNEE